MKRFVFVPILLLAVAWFALPPAPEATSQPIPVAKHIAKSLPAQTKDVKLDVTGVGVKDVERVIMIPKVVTVKTVASFPFVVSAEKGAGLYFWQYPASVSALDRGDSLEVTAADKGELTIGVKLISANLDKDGRFIGFITKFGSVTFAVGDVPPGPLPPDPKPPDPKPPVPPEPAPINADGLHVMILFETADKAKLPAGQFDIIYGAEMRDWLKANCTADLQTNDKKAYWVVDKDADLSQLDKKWQDAAKRPRQSIPWLIVSNRQKGGFEGPLPADTSTAIKLMEKYK